MPLKPWQTAKSRLTLDNESRSALAEAFAYDVLDVVAASECVSQLVVVTTEPRLVSGYVGESTVVVLPRTNGLNNAVRCGGRWLRLNNRPGPIAVIPGDLPSLTLPSLDRVFEAASQFDRAHVPDLDGVGTTILTASSPNELSPSYGPDSAHMHAIAGSHLMADADIRTRRDVDTLADLFQARLLGVGAHSAAAVKHLRLSTLKRESIRKSMCASSIG